MRSYPSTAAALVALLLASSAQAAPKVDFSKLEPSAKATPPAQGDKPHPVVARLLVDQATVKPGSVARVGVHLEQAPEWHTYWKSPGDIGLPTKITWKLPAGFEAGPQIFPIPERYDADGMVSYGYHPEVLHTVELKIPADAAKGPVTLEADVEWLVCKTSCIPGAVHVATTLQVGDAAAPSPWVPLFDDVQTRWPTPPDKLDTLAVRAVVGCDKVAADGPFRVAFEIKGKPGHTLTPPGAQAWPTFAAIAGMDWIVSGVDIKPQADGAIVILNGTTLTPDPLPARDEAGGLIQVQVDGKWVRTEQAVPLAWAPKGTACAASKDPVWAAAGVSPDPTAGQAPPAAPPPEPAKAAPKAEEKPAPPPPVAPPAAEDASAWSPVVVIGNLLLALLGGLILNIMPCVLPVLTLKLYGLVEQAGIPDADKRKAGLAYTAGIVTSFWALAAAVWGARSVLDMQVGWGFQFQYPGYVAALATIVYVFGLSLFGVFELPALGAGSADELSRKEGLAGYFFTGVFATLVATPCSAPFLGTAIAFAFQAPTALLFVSFTAIGLGLASPFLIVAWVPAAYRLLPRPGAWMEAFKQLLGFTLMATTVWLFDVLAAQIGADGATGFLGFLIFVSVGAWVYGRWGGLAAEPAEQVRALAAAVVISGLGGWWLLDLTPAEAADCDDGTTVAQELSYKEEIPWQAFHEQRVAALAGKTLFLDFTADWCVSCKVNERTILETASVRGAMERLHVVPLKADWTRRDAVIGAWLSRYQRAGVPMYLVIPPSGVQDAILLPEVITPDMVIGALEKAAKG